ncbi:hypothetical protein B0O80DRAFT_494507 [Mortierella sp. GBAus27b]|nr:hypothetical protein BGX31_010365 [Mortierella sp. GBA43]KAI8360328.1 hypothetical protein B0O80DRAFT_494507 [Mortierella sp. GBAus27b]
MADPIQVDAALLEGLTSLGPDCSKDIHVHSSTSSRIASNETCSDPLHDQDSASSNSKHTKLAFQPHRRYYLEGRVIHKRKLSRKLFFLDVSLVRPKRLIVPTDTTRPNPIHNTPTPTSDGLELSSWEDMELDQGSTGEDPSPHHQGTLAHSKPYSRMEVIARYPVHSLKDLGDLWHKVQLGSVIKVYGDIELSERSVDDNEDQKHRWTTLLHCLDFDVLELWQGKEGFEANPGTSELKGQNPGSRMERRKRKSGEISCSNGSENVNPNLATNPQVRGDDSQPHCKFWLNSGKCNKEQCPFWHETDLMKLKVERRRWVEERIQAKRQISHHTSDPHQHTTKNQHRERALYFAHWLTQTFTREFLNSGSGVLDIAGGRGDLSWELQTRQGIKSTIVEPRSGKGMRKWQRKWLQKFKATTSISSSNEQDTSPVQETNGDVRTDIAGGNALSHEKTDDPEEQEPDDGKDLEGLQDFIPTTLTYPLQMTEPMRIQERLDDQFLTTHQDLVSRASILVGLHPDQATEPIVNAALKTGKPFAIIPCCVFGRDNPHRRLPKLPAPISPNSDVEMTTSKETEVEEHEEDDDNDPLTRPVTSYDDFVLWLSSLHPDIETTWLNFEGMNRVLFWRGSPPSLTKPPEQP